jgi:hypothetical protein
MHEQIERPDQDISIVIYDNPLPPKYLKINKKLIKHFFVAVPLFFVFIIAGIVIWSLGEKSFHVTKKEISHKLDLTLQNKIKDLSSEVEDLKKSNKNLTDKLSLNVTPSEQDEVFLINIKKPYGMQNLISSNTVSVGQFTHSQEADKVSLNFQIISTVPETKIMGHVLVYMHSKIGLGIYPHQDFLGLQEGIKYSSGEPFSVSRLRPTTAHFSKSLSSDTVYFSIFIFNREGDLLLIKRTDPIKLGK